MVLLLIFRTQSSNETMQRADLTVFLFFLATILCLAPLPAVGVRRLHDTGHAAAWLLLNLVPFVGGLTILVWLCQEGDTVPNRFGPPMDNNSLVS